MNEEVTSPIQIQVTATGAQVNTIIAPGVVLTQILPSDMVEDIYRNMVKEQRKQKQTDIQVVRTLRNVKQ